MPGPSGIASAKASRKSRARAGSVPNNFATTAAVVVARQTTIQPRGSPGTGWASSRPAATVRDTTRAPSPGGGESRLAKGARNRRERSQEGDAVQQEVGIETEIRRSPRMTMCEPFADGLKVSFAVVVGGQPELHTYMVGAPGRKTIQEAVNGGLEIAHAGEMPADPEGGSQS